MIFLSICHTYGLGHVDNDSQCMVNMNGEHQNITGLIWDEDAH